MFIDWKKVFVPLWSIDKQWYGITGLFRFIFSPLHILKGKHVIAFITQDANCVTFCWQMTIDPGRPSFQGVFRMYLSFLNDKNAPLSFKVSSVWEINWLQSFEWKLKTKNKPYFLQSKAVQLLPYFTKLPADHLSQLRWVLSFAGFC